MKEYLSSPTSRLMAGLADVVVGPENLLVERGDRGGGCQAGKAGPALMLGPALSPA